MTPTGTISKTNTSTEENRIKDKLKDLKEATKSKDFDTVLENVKKVDDTCSFGKCKTRTNVFGIDCKFCSGRFCTAHALQEIHGCGEAVRRDEKRKYLHPDVKLTQENHSKAESKLTQKIKHLQQERKSKQGFTSKTKKK